MGFRLFFQGTNLECRLSLVYIRLCSSEFLSKRAAEFTLQVAIRSCRWLQAPLFDCSGHSVCARVWPVINFEMIFEPANKQVWRAETYISWCTSTTACTGCATFVCNSICKSFSARCVRFYFGTVLHRLTLGTMLLHCIAGVFQSHQDSRSDQSDAHYKHVLGYTADNFIRR